MKKVLMIIIIALALGIAALSLYRFKFYNTDLKEHYFDKIEVKNYKSDEVKNDILDSVTYKDNIITEKLLSIDYNFLHDTESITGKVYIGTDKYLYITDTNKNSVYRISDVKFKTMYIKDFKYPNGIYVYLLSESNKPYMMILEGNDITKAKVIGTNTKKNYTNFVNISFKEDKFKSGNSVFVLDDVGNIYDAATDIRYQVDIISLYNIMYVYGDKTLSNPAGMMIEDKNGNSYKIKYIFWISKANGFIDDNLPIIITEDNKFIYLNQDTTYVYEFDKKVKEITFDQYRPYIRGNISITFEDDYSVKFEGSCNQYYCINEFSD